MEARNQRKINLARLRESTDESFSFICGCAEDPNKNYRDYMEDKIKIIDNFMADTWYFAIFDGHGGSEVSNYCKRHLDEELVKLLHNNTNVGEALTNCFRNIDSQVRMRGHIVVGSTATVVLIRKERNEKVIYVANIGDSHAVIVTNRGTERLTTEDRTNNRLESKRIEASGGVISGARVSGQLAITRAFGDFHLKSSGVISEPHIKRRVILPSDLYLIIASDGLWDFVNDSELTRITGKNAMVISGNLLEKAQRSGSSDNISIISICLN